MLGHHAEDAPLFYPRRVDEADENLQRLVQREIEEGRAFLAAKGYQGSSITVTGPSELGVRIVALKLRLDGQPPTSAEVLVEIDPARVGWYIEANLSIYTEDSDPISADIGRTRVTDPTDPDFWARVMVRRAYVTLWERLEGRGEASDPAHLHESHEAVREWRRLERAITEEIGAAAPVVRIPDWEPVDLREGLRWIRDMVLEGWYVDYLVETDQTPPVLWLKLWEYGEPEPSWEAIRR